MVNYFYLKDGRIIKTIEELPDILETLDDSIFYEHVTPYKNDFAKWVFDEFKNVELANLLGNLKSKEETIRTIRAYLKLQELKKEQIKNEINKETRDETKKEIKNEFKDINTDKLSEKEEDVRDLKDIKNLEISKNSTKEPIKENIQENKNQENNIKKDSQIFNESINKSTNENEKNFNETPDDFFKKNPVIIEQVIEAKKENIVLEPLLLIDFDKNNSQKSIEIFKDNYVKAYQRMSFLRKAGFDTSLAEMMLFRVLPKIKLYESTNEEKDGLAVKRFLNEAIEELNNLK